jgi:hypothetical protein
MANTITSANAVFLLNIPGVTVGPVQLQGWGVDEAFDTDAVDICETQVGVDGTGVAGLVPYEVPQTMTLIASSASNDLFDAWNAIQASSGDIVYASAQIRIPALASQLSMPQGVLKRYKPLADAKKVLMPRAYGLVWLPQPGVLAMSVSPM